jgi:REP element-mobilizing transposase RayT
MPDHVHLFAALAEPDYDFDAWVKYWKRLFTQRVKLADFRWQTDHWDTRMRTDRQYAEKWEYVRENPVRHGLVAEPEMWPFAGEVNEFGW